MKLVIPGGSGQVGRLLTQTFAEDGHEIVVLTRTPDRVESPSVRQITWDGRTIEAWAAELEGADAVINLAGRSVNCRYTPSNRRAILESRIDSTKALGEAIALCTDPPRVWLHAGAATIYAHRYDAPKRRANGSARWERAGSPGDMAFQRGRRPPLGAGARGRADTADAKGRPPHGNRHESRPWLGVRHSPLARATRSRRSFR